MHNSQSNMLSAFPSAAFPASFRSIIIFFLFILILIQSLKSVLNPFSPTRYYYKSVDIMNHKDYEADNLFKLIITYKYQSHSCPNNVKCIFKYRAS